MSKSAGNFFMVRDAAETYGYETIRMFMLSAHYRTPLNYSAESLEMNKASLARLYESRNNLEFRISKAEGDAMTAEEAEKLAALAQYKQKFIDAMESPGRKCHSSPSRYSASLPHTRILVRSTMEERKPPSSLVQIPRETVPFSVRVAERP
jgi:leucyl-tRNA synthetase